MGVSALGLSASLMTLSVFTQDLKEQQASSIFERGQQPVLTKNEIRDLQHLTRHGTNATIVIACIDMVMSQT